MLNRYTLARRPYYTTAQRLAHLGAIALVCLFGSRLDAQITYTVTTVADNGAGSLRAHVAAAEADGAMSVIRFAAGLAGQTIVLTSGQLTVTKSLEIDGTAAAGVKISGGWDGVLNSTVGSRILLLPAAGMQAGRTVTLRGVHLTRANPGNTSSGANAGADPPATGVGSSNGGCIFVNGGTLVVEDAMMSFGTGNDGGLIEIVAGTATLTRSTFFSSRTRDDGAALDIKTGVTVTATNCTFYDNFTGFGGVTGHAGSAARNDGTLLLEHCTLAYNHTVSGGTIDNRGTLRLGRNVFVNNTTDETGVQDINNTGTPAGTVTNLSGGTLATADGNYTDYPVTGAMAGFTQHSADQIRLGALAANGGPTLTCALDCGSVLVSSVTASRTIDQTGASRESGAASEPGAFEVKACPDADADATNDFADADDDNDGIPDVAELSFAPVVTNGLGDRIAVGATLAAQADPVAGTTVTYGATNSNPSGSFSAVVEAGVHGTTGVRVLSDPATTSDEHLLRIDFADAVYDLNFSVSDLDESSTASRETVTVTLFYGTRSFAITSANVTLGSNVTRVGNRFQAAANAPGNGKTATNGRFTIANFPYPVTRVELRFEHGLVSGNPPQREFFLSGLTFRSPGALDPERDGRAAPLDLDADGDGIVDHVEAQSTAGYTPGATIATPVDTDGDGTPDFLDTDSDDDGEPDAIEGHDPDNDGVADAGSPAGNGTFLGSGTGTDADGDGINDGFDNAVGFNPTNGTTPASYPENDATGPDRDWRDNDANIAGYVWDDANGDGIRQETETGVANAAIVKIRNAGTDALLATLTTNASGYFLVTDFDNVGRPGAGVASFVIEFDAPSGLSATVAPDAGADDRRDSDYAQATRRTPAFTLSESSPVAFLGAGFRAAPLPVTFVDVAVDADGDERCARELVWRVAQEREVARYEVQRRDDGASDYATVAETPARGTNVYTAVLPQGAGYYRVVAIDRDGSRGYSAVVVATACAKTAQSLRAFPNPVRAGATLTVDVADRQEAVTVVDLHGRTVARYSPGGSPVVAVETAGLVPGMYVVRVGASALRIVVE